MKPRAKQLKRGPRGAQPVALSATGISVTILEGVSGGEGSVFEEMVAELVEVVLKGWAVG
jgi:hypothetical protein